MDKLSEQSKTVKYTLSLTDEMLENSNDGGQTFGTGQERSIGAQGKYRHRVRWTRQGASRDRVVRVTCSEPIPLTFMSAHVNLRGER